MYFILATLLKHGKKAKSEGVYLGVKATDWFFNFKNTPGQKQGVDFTRSISRTESENDKESLLGQSSKSSQKRDLNFDELNSVFFS